MFIIYITLSTFLKFFFYYLFGLQLGATVNLHSFLFPPVLLERHIIRFSLLINVITYGALTFLKVLVLRIQKKKKHAEHFCLINEPLNIIIKKQLNKHGKYICFSTCLKDKMHNLFILKTSLAPKIYIKHIKLLSSKIVHCCQCLWGILI